MQIDVYSDIVCPWCRIGKSNLTKALELWAAQGGETAAVTYRAFQLDPTVPREGLPFAEAMETKMGGQEGALRAAQRVTEAGAAVGVTFRYDRITRLPNTKLAHRLVKLTPERLQAETVEALFRAYFEDGADIARLETLEALAAAIGPEAADAASLLRTEETAGEAQVDADLQLAERLGVTGVPFFVFNNRFSLSGAYPAEQLAELLKKVADA
ncbi:DsbA family oxidoreductase [Paenibacillus humicola]|uniref:DsbA family oxidoreductase n=1 Tax=Paenibacillus humicola TaxID=3110540 RepID=UPI00237A8222|nr:DsbA family oxidoreductase [Paenibacillus humicola]